MKFMKVVVSAIAIGSSAAAPMEHGGKKKNDVDPLKKIWKQSPFDVFGGARLHAVRKCVQCNAKAKKCTFVFCHLELGPMHEKTVEEVKKTGRPLYAMPRDREKVWLTMEEGRAMQSARLARKAKNEEKKMDGRRKWRTRYEKWLQEHNKETTETLAGKKGNDKREEQGTAQDMADEEEKEDNKAKEAEKEKKEKEGEGTQ